MTDYFEEHARMERCGEEATSLFMLVCRSALAEYYTTMAHAVDPVQSPRWHRFRDAARKKYQLVSVPAWEIRNRAVQDLWLTGEVSEATAFMFDELKVAQAMEIA